jgi:two-component system NtrC family sensor kinase
MIKLSVKSKIWFTVLSVVLMFAFFVLYYFPEQQQKTLLNNYNTEVQNLANTVALGVKIALTEQNFEGVQTAMDFVKMNEELVFVSLVQKDGVSGKKEVFKTYPEKFPVSIQTVSNDSMIVKNAPFITPNMQGEIMLAMGTHQITESKKDIRNTSLLVCLLVLFVGIFFGFLLSKNISVPVLALRDAAIKVGQGDRTQQVSSKGKDEIGELGRAFNKMVKALEIAESERKSAQDQLIHSEKMASLGQMTAGIAHEIKNPLNFVNNFSALSVELLQELEVTTDPEEKIEIMDSLKSNLTKITAHGKRADSIVATMLQHSRGTSGAKVPTDINQLCSEFTDLAFHGMRANSRDFNCVITKNFEENLPHINAIPQDLSRVILNLLNNGFYAVADRVKKSEDPAFKPEIRITTEKKAGVIFIHIRDNGSGIPKAIKDKIFEPFFTTKPTGEGTGLGLSLSYDIVTKEHQGMMSVQSEEGTFTEFTIQLPV